MFIMIQKREKQRKKVPQNLEGLEKEGLLKRTYGGAIPTNRISLELFFKAREIEHKEEKKAIGKVAAGLIEDGMP